MDGRDRDMQEEQENAGDIAGQPGVPVWEYLGQEGYALTREEIRQIMIGRRDRLYMAVKRATIGFTALSLVLMAGFKMNEGFLDANSRLGVLMESLNAQADRLSQPKINVRTSFRDEAQSRLVIPLLAPIDRERVNIREEFIRNKLVITLSGYSDKVPDGVELVSDSGIMDAVGVYRQNDDVVFEVYCRDRYDYGWTVDGHSLTITFCDLQDVHAATAVIWLPYQDRNRLALPEWRQILDRFAQEEQVKLYMASDMYEEYSQSDIIAFADRIGADMVLGVQVEQTSGPQSYLTGICNTTYFMPDYNSAVLSVIMAETFVEQTQIAIRGFEEGGSESPLVSEAVVPAAMVRISLTQEDMESVENAYRLNEKIAVSLESTMRSVLEEYLDTGGNGDED